MLSFSHSKTVKKTKNYRQSFFVLFFLLLAIVFFKTELTKPQFSQGIAALFNIKNSKKTKSVKKLNSSMMVSLKKQNLFWCTTRVIGLSTGKNYFVNKHFKWYLNQNLIDSLFMERWLAQNCKLEVLFTGKILLSSKSPKPLFCVNFIDGQKRCFLKKGSLFFLESQQFLSPQLKEAFEKILFLTNNS